MSNKQNEILMEEAIEIVDESIEKLGNVVTEEQRKQAIEKQYQILMGREV